MAVSLLEAASAQTASQYIAASRLPAQREQVGADFCHEHSVLPLWREPAGVLVATTRPRDEAMLRELRQRLGQPVIVRVSGRGEIRIGINAAVDALTGADWRQALAEILEDLRIMRPGQGATYTMAADDEAYLGAGLVDAGVLNEIERLELVGLAFHLPSVDFADHPPEPDLDALLAVDTMRSLRVLPLWAVRDELFLAVEAPPSPAVTARLERQLGLLVRPVLVPPEALGARLSDLHDDPPVETAELRGAVLSAGLVSATQFASAAEIAETTGESVPRALEHLHGVDAARTELALARRGGVQPYRGPESVDPDAVRSIPLGLSRRWRVAVIGRSDDEITVAMVDPWSSRIRRGLAALTHGRVQPVLAGAAEIDALLAQHGRTDGRDVLAVGDPLRTSLLLLRANFVDRQMADVAEIDIAHLTQQTLPHLWGLMQNGKRSEAVALDAALPRLHELLLRPQPAAAALQHDGVDGNPLLPMLLQDDVLTVAIASPDIADDARRLASANQRALRLAITREDDIDAARRELAFVDLAALSQPREELGRLIERRFDVGRVEVLALFRRMQEENEPLDVAAQRLHQLRPAQVREAMAEYMGRRRSICIAATAWKPPSARRASPSRAACWTIRSITSSRGC